MGRQKVAVIGFGIAGAVFALQCQSRGYEVHVFDDFKTETPSKVAAGIINPLSVSRKKPLWCAKEFAKEAWRFYSKWDTGFTYQYPMVMDIKNTRLQNEWSSSLAEETGFLNWSDDHSQLEINYSGWIDTELLIESSTNQINYYHRKRINDLEELEKSFDYVVLATGKVEPEIMGSQFREDLFRPVLGDLLEVSLKESYPFKHLEGLFVIPQRIKDTYILGSTYIHDFDKIEPNPERASLLVAKAERQGVLITKILNHRTAVRPAIYDRMPIVGQIRNNLHVFAGMGSRGLFHAPLAAKMLLDSWEGETISPLLNVSRSCTK